MPSLVYNIDPATHEALAKYAQERDLTLSQAATELISRAFHDPDVPKEKQAFQPTARINLPKSYYLEAGIEYRQKFGKSEYINRALSWEMRRI